MPGNNKNASMGLRRHNEWSAEEDGDIFLRIAGGNATVADSLSQLTSGSFTATRNDKTQLGRTTFSGEDQTWEKKQNEYAKKRLERVKSLERELCYKEAALRQMKL